MKPEQVTISVKMDAQTFRDFAVFDTMSFRKRWINPAIFAGILTVFSVICFLLRSEQNQAELLAIVLLVIALGLPAVYFGMYFYSLNAQIKQLNLKRPKPVYDVELTTKPDGVKVTSTQKKGGGTVRQQWKTVFGAYRTAHCIYFYVSDRQAFLLPDHQADVEPDVLWEFLAGQLPPEKLHDCRTKREKK